MEKGNFLVNFSTQMGCSFTICIRQSVYLVAALYGGLAYTQERLSWTFLKARGFLELPVMAQRGGHG